MLQPAVFRVPKAGASQAEYEDAVAWSRRHGRFAVADGASASAFARLWAWLLVRAYVGGQLTPCSLERDLAPLQRRWSKTVNARDLPWYAVEQVRRGAFAALVGLSVYDTGTWSALAVGDCCLFQVRDGQLLTALPLDDAAAFDDRPLLLGSQPTANIQLREAGAIAAASGSWQPGDTFLLMSDALAASFLHQSQRASESPLSVLSFERSPAGFRTWLRQLRSERLIRNDDVSLLWLATATTRDAAA